MSRGGVLTRDRAFEVPRDFDFPSTVYSHGWCKLAPNRADTEAGTLEPAEDLERFVYSEGTR